MKEREQITHFANDIDNLVERYRREYDISYAAILGVLNMKIHLLCEEATARANELDDEDDE